MTDVLDLAAARAARYLKELPDRPVAPTASIAELRSRLAGPVPEAGLPAETVIDQLVRDVDGGLMGSSSGRFFGWVIGGTLPAAMAAARHKLLRARNWDVEAQGLAGAPRIKILATESRHIAPAHRAPLGARHRRRRIRSRCR